MKHINLVLNGKGGVGKSFFAVNLVQFFKDRGLPMVAIDTDNENSTLVRFHPDAQFVDLAQARQLDQIFAALEKAPTVIVDARAASTDLFLGYFKEIDLERVLAELGASLTLAIPINHEADSVDQVQRLVGSLGALCRYLIVRNAAHSESFTLYDNLDVRTKLQGELGAREIEMPRLQDWLVEALNRHDLTITSAVGHQAFSLLDRQRLTTWQRRFYAGIDSALGLLASVKKEVAHA